MITKTKILYALLLFVSLAYSQERTRLHGKVSTQFGVVANGTVLNLNSKTRQPITEVGYFEILAKPKDTLLFTGLACLPKTIVLNTSNFNPAVLEVTLEMFDNELKEVIILNQKEIRPTSANSQKYVDKKYFADNQSSPTNPLMPSSPIPNGTDLVRLFKEVKKIIKKKEPVLEEKQKTINFYKEVTRKTPTSFFVNTLKIKESEILLFLSFCEKDKKATQVITEYDDFFLYDFLISKNIEFKSFSTFDQ